MNPIKFQRLEGLTIFILALSTYIVGHRPGWSWLFFALLLFLPDISMLGYLRNPKFGALIYNIGHTLVTPLALITSGVLVNYTGFWSISLIWLAHIGLDRALGYGLKESDGFTHTHLGRIGQKSSN